MTQEFVTLPRSVVEQALEALETGIQYDYRGNPYSDNDAARCGAYDALRAALDQPQVEQPAMTPIAQRKLDSLLAEGYTISGYSVYHERKHQHGFVTVAGLVGWWKPEGVEYPQPHVEQEPVAWALSHSRGLEFSSTYPMQKSKQAAEQMARQHMGAVTVSPLYTHPQPKREPLTDEEIAYCIFEARLGAEGAFKRNGSSSYRIARAIEAAHNIK